MANLSSLIDSLPVPSLPSNFTDTERDTILYLIEESKYKARPYSGDYIAPWLLADFTAIEWFTTNRGREEIINGIWHNTINVRWDIALPDGLLLTDPKYNKLLTMNRRIAFLARNGAISDITGPINWKALVAVQFALTRWVVLNESQFRPAEFGFKLLDQFSLETLVSTLAQGGWAEAFRFPQRLLKKLYEESHGEPCPLNLTDAVYDVPEATRKKIGLWLEDNGYYGKIISGVNRGKMYVKRDMLAKLIFGQSENISASAKLNAFCRQFEPDFPGQLLVSTTQSTEKPSHKIKLISDVVNFGAAENTLSSVTTALTNILSSYRHVPDMIPEPALFSVRSAHVQALKQTRQSAHTHFMPINTGLAYLNKAMELVHTYGEAVVACYLEASKAAPFGNPSLSGVDTHKKVCIFEMFNVSTKHGEQSLATALGIRELRRPATNVDYELLRKHPTLDQALRVIVGACVICIGLLKPSREVELTHMKRDCLFEGPDGYYMRYSLAKSNAGESHQDKDRPIPLIAARAIVLLQRLGDGLSQIYGDNRKASNNLFYIPKVCFEGALAANKLLLNNHLDDFCDYVGLNPDGSGRRWYIRIHEMRKWFLLLLFWSAKYDVLDAARWIAGHIDSAHIDAYIENEFPGESLPALEANYAINRLRAARASEGSYSPIDADIDGLYEAVLKHFGVQALSFIPESEWADYVTELRMSDSLSLVPYAVRAGTAGFNFTTIDVSFVLREV